MSAPRIRPRTVSSLGFMRSILRATRRSSPAGRRSAGHKSLEACQTRDRRSDQAHAAFQRGGMLLGERPEQGLTPVVRLDARFGLNRPALVIPEHVDSQLVLSTIASRHVKTETHRAVKLATSCLLV